MNERRVLESWKAIASYLGRTEKTCRKWERELGLPIHRLDNSAKAHVFAYEDELDRWREEKLQAEKVRKARRFFGLAARPSPTKLWLIAASGLVVLIVGGLFIRQLILNNRLAISQTVKGVAVMPFEDLSPSKDYEHVCNGIFAALTDALGNLEGLRVPAPASALYFRGKNTPLQEIGKKLNVDYVLGASVQVDGDRLRVIPQLQRVADGYLVWSEKYDRSQADLFAVEDDVARGVAKALEIKLLGAPGAAICRPGTQNLEAYNLFLRGNHFSSKGRFFYKQAIECYEKALEKDPNYAHAYIGIAGCYSTLGSLGLLPTDEAWSKAKQAAMKALEIDASSTGALRILASMKMTYEWDFRGAEQDIRKAIRINPADAGFHACYADLLSATGRHEEALAEAQLAAESNPLAPGFLNALAMYTHYRSRNYELALESLKKSLDLDPYFVGTYINMIGVYIAMGRYEEAQSANYRKRELIGISSKPDDNDYWSALIHAWAGNQAEARRILANVKVNMKETYIPTDFVVLIHAALGDMDEAFAWLEQAYQERDPILYAMKVLPLFDPLRSDPRFADYLRRIGLEK